MEGNGGPVTQLLQAELTARLVGASMSAKTFWKTISVIKTCRPRRSSNKSGLVSDGSSVCRFCAAQSLQRLDSENKAAQAKKLQALSSSHEVNSQAIPDTEPTLTLSVKRLRQWGRPRSGAPDFPSSAQPHLCRQTPTAATSDGTNGAAL